MKYYSYLKKTTDLPNSYKSKEFYSKTYYELTQEEYNSKTTPRCIYIEHGYFIEDIQSGNVKVLTGIVEGNRWSKRSIIVDEKTNSIRIVSDMICSTIDAYIKTNQPPQGKIYTDTNFNKLICRPLQEPYSERVGFVTKPSKIFLSKEDADHYQEYLYQQDVLRSRELYAKRCEKNLNEVGSLEEHIDKAREDYFRTLENRKRWAAESKEEFEKSEKELERMKLEWGI